MAPETVSQLVSQGRAAASVGEKAVAESYFRRAAELDRDSVEAWLALSSVVPTLAEKRRCLERVRALDPSNEEAKTALAWVARKETEAAELNAGIAQAPPAARVAPPLPAQAAGPDEVLYCANHPNVETVLRCNRCSKPICTRCAIRTPVGFRCPECVREQRAVYFSGGAGEYVVAAIVALALSFPAAFLMSLLSWFTIFLGPLAGGIIAEAVRLATRRRRAQHTWRVVAVCMAAGSLPAIALSGFGSGLIWLLVYLVLGIGAAVARLR